MKLLSGLFMAAKRRLMAQDNESSSFSEKLNDLVKRKDELAPEGITSIVEELKKLCEDIPESEEKSKLMRFLEDFKEVKSQSPEVAKEAAGAVIKQYESICSKAVSEVPETGSTENKEPPNSGSTENKEPPNSGSTEKTEDGIIEAAKKIFSTNDGNSQQAIYEDIYQFVKKRFAEDAKSNSNGSVTDHAPHIPVTISPTNKTGGLKDLFKMTKGEMNG